MDDEEEEQLPRCCETALRNKSSENRNGLGVEVGQTANRHGQFEDRSTQTASSVHNSASHRDMAPFQGSGRNTSSHCRPVGARTGLMALCGTGGFAEEPRALFHGNAGFRAHFPALFEQVVEGTDNNEEMNLDERNQEEGKEELDGGLRVEVQIGRKLREMGDRFQQEHLQMITPRAQFGFFHLVTSLCNFLFPREEPRNAGTER